MISMTIEEDKGKLLIRLYQLNKFGKSDLNELKNESGWDEKRICDTLHLLFNSGFIKVKIGSGTARVCDNVIFEKITGSGDDIIENPQQFMNIFGISVIDANKF
jgi:hypothetical protein